MKRIILILLLMVSHNANSSECVIAENFKGYIAKKYNNFVFEEDAMTRGKWVIYINGDKSSVLPESGMTTVIQTAPNSLLATAVNKNGSTIETWTVFTKEKKVLYTKTANWSEGLDGINTFVGDITGKCEQ